MTLAHRLGRAAALLTLLGLLTGLPLAQAMSGQVNADVGSLIAAHLNALTGAGWMIGLAWSLPMLRYGEVGLTRLAWLTTVCNYANWAVTLGKAFLRVKGVGATGDLANDVVFGLLGALVVAPAIVAGAAWVYGFGGRRAG
ncbi:MAG: hypothetical protein EXR79_05120 [Myxococcales bacterium]|nr:hypothetical protein [Myxococcales bacterium]